MTPEERKKLSHRNFLFMILDGSLFWLAVNFIDPTTVASVFITEFSGSMQLAGLAQTLRQAAQIVGTFIMGMFMYKVSDCGAVFRKFATLARMPLLLISPLLLLGVSGTPMALWFILMQTLFFFIDGFMGLCYQSLNANTIESQDRGPIAGIQQIISGGIGLISVTIIKFLMTSPLSPNLRYAAIFGICGVVFIINSLALRQLRDAPRESLPKKHPSLWAYIREFGALWVASREFRHIFYGRALFSGGIMSASILLLFGSRDMNLSLDQSSTMVYVQLAGVLVGGASWGLLNRHLGNAKTMILCNLPAIAVGALGIVLFLFARGSRAFWPMAILLFLSSSSQNVAMVGFTNSVFERMPKVNMAGYLVLQSLVLLPFTLLPWVAGLIAQISFLPLFALVAAFGVAGTLYCIRYDRWLKKEIAREAIEG